MRYSLAAGAALLTVFASLAACGDSDGEPVIDGIDAAPTGDAASPSQDGDDADTGLPPANDANGADALADGSACPTGSTLRKVRSSCPGAPLVAPAALVSDLASASAGDVVSLAGVKESDAPCLPVVVCTPDDAPTLLFSDSPEMPSSDGVLYADTVPAGRYRLYVYHANGSASARKFPVVVLNADPALPATVTIVRRGLGTPSTSYVAIGKAVLLDWLADAAPIAVTVPAGQRVLLDPDLDALHATQNELVHAIYDVVVDRPVKISFVSVLAGADAAASTAGLSLLTRDADHQRGTFPQADALVVLADVAGGAQQKGVQRLRLGLDQVDDPLTGIDVPTGDPQTLLGNYGLRYRFALGRRAAASLALAPRGGGWGGASRSGTTRAALPSATEQLASTTDCIALGAASDAELQLLTGGGSNLPVDLLVVTP